MNLAECLSNADIATLRSIADTYELTCSRHSKLALMQELLYLFRSKKFLRDELKRWKEGNPEGFLRLGLETRGLYSAEELTGMFRRSSSDGRPGVDDGVIRGFIFPTTRESGRLQYCLPKEIHEVMQEETVQVFYAVMEQSDSGPLTYQEADYALQRDLDLFLQYLSRHDVQLTTGGSMYKRHLERILQIFEVSETPLEGGWRFGYGRRFYDYPDRFALIYDYAYANHLIEEGRDGLLRTTDRAEEWQMQTQAARQKSLVQFYISSYRRPIPRLPQIVRMMLLAPQNRWLASDSFLDTCGELVCEYYYDTRESVWRLRILNMLCYLGIIRLGEDENQKLWFQTTKLGQQLLTKGAVAAASESQPDPRRVVIVQPNFEIFAASAEPAIIAEIAALSELKQGGPLQVYRLTRDSVIHALGVGKSVTKWLQYMQSCSQTPIPGNVERTLMEWESQFHDTSGTATDTMSS
ncbi:helicase-associated domain-containing protein [Alicyclobacillus ferrooxydans]|uniref:Helicase XPB/Ssl2 N-terminal domain-containing protein n=1 Tax=Alicyclobacillus ferrooxydans TaxID=471514 RepID=A0A0P9GUD5_9BACL|nr:helicase-associated domain-containing protein [Alicyclobacillus ferrooxydans]KPV44867.1 hypothetical protein AN477_05125 [Alicyclobacillus ferrooxydans]